MQHIPTQNADTLHLYFQLTLIYVQIWENHEISVS